MGASHEMRDLQRIAVWLAMVTSAACGGGGGDNPPCTGTDCTTIDVPGCAEAWQCTPWTTDGQSDQGVRTCTDLNACGTTATKPPETAALPALDPEYYECNVEPVLTRSCAMVGCHGTETGRALRLYARGRLRITGETITEPGGCGGAGTMYPSETCTGSIECKCWSTPQLTDERRRNFDSARGFALDAAGAPLGDVTQSELLRQPQAGGGFAHAGMVMWSAGDNEYSAVKNWLTGASLGSPCNSMN